MELIAASSTEFSALVDAGLGEGAGGEGCL